MIWIGIAWIGCLGVVLELAHRAPIIPEGEEL
jgi:hypothetical protein